MKSADFLDAVKQRHALATDYRLAKFLRWPQGRVSMYRIGKREFDDEACVQIAEALDVPAPYVMACVAAARAKSTAIRKHWEGELVMPGGERYRAGELLALPIRAQQLRELERRLSVGDRRPSVWRRALLLCGFRGSD